VVVEEGYQDLLVSVERKPFPSLEAMRNIKRLMAVQTPKAANVKVEELIDTRLIRKLERVATSTKWRRVTASNETGILDGAYRTIVPDSAMDCGMRSR
jgi:hypothetical protein